MRPTFAAVGVLLFGLTPLWGQTPAKKKDKPDDLFGTTKLHTLDLVLTEQAWEEMQPLQGVRPNPPRDKRPPATGPDGKPAPTPAQKAAQQPRQAVVSPFGVEFPYVKADVECAGKTYKDVGLRFKGNSAYLTASLGLKRPWKIDFDRNVDGQRFFGLTTLNLMNNAMDPSQLREALSYHVYRAAGVVAPRTAFAEVYVTVKGRFDRQLAGLYTLTEQIDNVFLKDRFRSARGLLLKPEGVPGLPYLGDDWAAYIPRYQPKTAGSDEATRSFMAFTKLVHNADDATFARDVAKHLDVDACLRYLAATIALANWDSFLFTGHNYYMYVHPKTKKIVFLPWDLNLSLGGLMGAMGLDSQTDLDIRTPSQNPNRLMDRLLAIKEYEDLYKGHLRALFAGALKPETFKADMDAILKVLKEPLERDAKRPAAPAASPLEGMMRAMMAGMPTLDVFIERRAASVAKQLDGKGEGKKLAFGMMGGGGAKPAAGAKPRRNPFSAGVLLGDSVFRGIGADKEGKLTLEATLVAAGRLFQELDRNKDNVVDGRELVDGLNRILSPMGFGMGAAAAAKPEPPAQLKTKRPPPVGMGPGFFLGDPILKLIDPNGDDKVTLAEWTASAKALFAKIDKDGKGTIDREALADGIDALFPPPPGLER